MGHDVVGMEQYVAEDTKPLARCLRDVALCDLYVVIAAWRYGYVPIDTQHNPHNRSITQLEFEQAQACRKPVLAFLLDPDAPWPPSAMDALGRDGGDDVRDFRAE